MAWRTLKRFIRALDKDGDVLRIERPVRVELEAGCIADLLVKTGGPAVVFENPELPDGTISDFPLVMNLFGTKDRTLRALQAKSESEIGERLDSLMKPDIGNFVSKPWKGLPLAKDALALPPKKVRRARCQEVAMDGVDLTRLPIPKTWPMDGGHYITLPLVVTKIQKIKNIILECIGLRFMEKKNWDYIGKYINMELNMLLHTKMEKCLLQYVLAVHQN